MPWTANDDQPGPTACFHNATGGAADQSVSILTPSITLLRSRPRKPGHSAIARGAPSAGAGVTDSGFAAGAGIVAARVLATDGAGVSAGGAVVAAGVTGAGGIGSLVACDNKRSSCVGVHRQ